jgi:AI-2 transport protein TqsA
MFSGNKELKEILKLAKIVLWLTLIIGTVLILKFFSNILKPLVIAVLIWYIVRVISNYIAMIKIGQFQLPDWLAKLLSLIVIVGAIYASVNIITVNISQIIQRIEQYNERQDNLLAQLADFFGIEDMENDIKNLPGSKELRPFLTSLANSLTEGIGYTIIIIIYLIFLLIEEFIFKKKIHKIYKDTKHFEAMKIVMDQMNNSIKRYFTVKTFASLLTAVLAYLVLRILDVDFPLLWAFIIYIFNFIPYVGSFAATILPSIFAALQFNSLSYFIWTFLLVQACQTLVANFIEPRIIGKSLNLSPLVVFITLTIWGSIWGVLGMIIAVPITSILVIIMAQFPNTRYVAVLLSESGDISNMIVPVQ